MAATVAVDKRFWRLVDKTSDCWLWKGFCKASGHGMLRDANGVPEQAHRVAWELLVGPIQKGMHVLHKCDVPNCVNPKHLYLGTHQDNMKDAKDRNRFKPFVTARGEANSAAKLTSAIVRRLRANTDCLSQRALAKLFGVAQPTIGKVLRGDTWKHVA